MNPWDAMQRQGQHALQKFNQDFSQPLIPPEVGQWLAMHLLHNMAAAPALTNGLNIGAGLVGGIEDLSPPNPGIIPSWENAHELRAQMATKDLEHLTGQMARASDHNAQLRETTGLSPRDVQTHPQYQPLTPLRDEIISKQLEREFNTNPKLKGAKVGHMVDVGGANRYVKTKAGWERLGAVPDAIAVEPSRDVKTGFERWLDEHGYN